MLLCEANCFTSDVQQCSVEKPAFSDGGIDGDYRKMPPSFKASYPLPESPAFGAKK